MGSSRSLQTTCDEPPKLDKKRQKFCLDKEQYHEVSCESTGSYCAVQNNDTGWIAINLQGIGGVYSFYFPAQTANYCGQYLDALGRNEKTELWFLLPPKYKLRFIALNSLCGDEYSGAIKLRAFGKSGVSETVFPVRPN